MKLEDLLDLAEATNLVFWETGAEEPICRLANGARDYWKTLQGRPESLRYGFVRRLLDRCPILYKNPLVFFDWVTNYLREIGEARKIDPKLDRDLWEIE